MAFDFDPFLETPEERYERLTAHFEELCEAYDRFVAADSESCSYRGFQDEKHDRALARDQIILAVVRAAHAAVTKQPRIDPILVFDRLVQGLGREALPEIESVRRQMEGPSFWERLLHGLHVSWRRLRGADQE